MKNLRQRFDLLALLINKEITLKYKRTYLGMFWSLLNPIFTAVVIIIAFSFFMRFEMKDYSLFLLSAMFPWNCFATSVMMSTTTLTNNVSLIKKVIFPRHFLIISTIIGQLITLVFSLPILLVLVFYYGKAPSLNWLIGIPLLMAIQFLVTLGVSLLLSVINAFFRDMEYVIGVLINMLFWLTPVIYPLDAVPEKFQYYLAINPITYLITSWRDLIMLNTINWSNIGLSSLVALVFFLIGLWGYNILNRKLDEVL